MKLTPDPTIAEHAGVGRTFHNGKTTRLAYIHTYAAALIILHDLSLLLFHIILPNLNKILFKLYTVV